MENYTASKMSGLVQLANLECFQDIFLSGLEGIYHVVSFLSENASVVYMYTCECIHTLGMLEECTRS